MSRIRNLTGHPLAVYAEGKEVAVFPSEGRVWLNANYQFVTYLDVDGFPIPVLSADEPTIDGLPQPVDDTYLIVTGLVAKAFPERGDLLSPARIVKEGEQSIGCRALLTQADRFNQEE